MAFDGMTYMPNSGFYRTNGGGAFIIPYLIAFLLLGIPLSWMEWTLGRAAGLHHHGTAPGGFHYILGKKPWAKHLGSIGLLPPIFIVFYYVFIQSWILAFAFYSLNGTVKEKKDPSVVNGTPEGDGSQGSPYNVAGALTFIKTLGSATSDYVYVKGIVVSINGIETDHGNATYYISDDAQGTDQLYIFRAKNLDNANYTSADELSVGDEVVLYGQLVNYQGNTPEMTQGGYIVSTTHKGPNYGTHDEPLSITEAKALKTADAAWVAGEVVGFVDGQDFTTGYTFFASVGQTGVNTNIIIDMGGNNTGPDFSLPVQLPRSMRQQLSLASNPDMLGKQLIIYGQIGSYLNATGILSPTYVEVYEGQGFGGRGELIMTIGEMPSE